MADEESGKILSEWCYISATSDEAFLSSQTSRLDNLLTVYLVRKSDKSSFEGCMDVCRNMFNNTDLALPYFTLNELLSLNEKDKIVMISLSDDCQKVVRARIEEVVVKSDNEEESYVRVFYPDCGVMEKIRVNICLSRTKLCPRGLASRPFLSTPYVTCKNVTLNQEWLPAPSVNVFGAVSSWFEDDKSTQKAVYVKYCADSKVELYNFEHLDYLFLNEKYTITTGMAVVGINLPSELEEIASISSGTSSELAFRPRSMQYRFEELTDWIQSRKKHFIPVTRIDLNSSYFIKFPHSPDIFYRCEFEKSSVTGNAAAFISSKDILNLILIDQIQILHIHSLEKFLSMRILFESPSGNDNKHCPDSQPLVTLKNLHFLQPILEFKESYDCFLLSKFQNGDVATEENEHSLAYAACFMADVIQLCTQEKGSGLCIDIPTHSSPVSGSVIEESFNENGLDYSIMFTLKLSSSFERNSWSSLKNETIAEGVLNSIRGPLPGTVLLVNYLNSLERAVVMSVKKSFDKECDDAMFMVDLLLIDWMRQITVGQDKLFLSCYDSSLYVKPSAAIFIASQKMQNTWSMISEGHDDEVKVFFHRSSEVAMPYFLSVDDIILSHNEENDTLPIDCIDRTNSIIHCLISGFDGHHYYVIPYEELKHLSNYVSHSLDFAEHRFVNVFRRDSYYNLLIKNLRDNRNGSTWWRVRLLKCVDEHSVMVFCIDLGLTLVVSSKRLRFMKEESRSKPPLAIPIKLVDGSVEIGQLISLQFIQKSKESSWMCKAVDFDGESQNVSQKNYPLGHFFSELKLPDELDYVEGCVIHLVPDYRTATILYPPKVAILQNITNAMRRHLQTSCEEISIREAFQINGLFVVEVDKHRLYRAVSNIRSHCIELVDYDESIVFHKNDDEYIQIDDSNHEMRIFSLPSSLQEELSLNRVSPLKNDVFHANRNELGHVQLGCFIKCFMPKKEVSSTSCHDQYNHPTTPIFILYEPGNILYVLHAQEIDVLHLTKLPIASLDFCTFCEIFSGIHESDFPNTWLNDTRQISLETSLAMSDENKEIPSNECNNHQVENILPLALVDFSTDLCSVNMVPDAEEKEEELQENVSSIDSICSNEVTSMEPQTCSLEHPQNGQGDGCVQIFGCISHILTPYRTSPQSPEETCRFYIQTISSMPLLDEIQDILNGECVALSSPTELNFNTVYAAPFNGTLYRGHIVKFGINVVTFFLIDYGNTEIISQIDIRVLPNAAVCHTTQKLANLCELSDVDMSISIECLEINDRVALQQIHCRDDCIFVKLVEWERYNDKMEAPSKIEQNLISEKSVVDEIARLAMSTELDSASQKGNLASLPNNAINKIEEEQSFRLKENLEQPKLVETFTDLPKVTKSDPISTPSYESVQSYHREEKVTNDLPLKTCNKKADEPCFSLNEDLEQSTFMKPSAHPPNVNVSLDEEIGNQYIIQTVEQLLATNKQFTERKDSLSGSVNEKYSGNQEHLSKPSIWTLKPQESLSSSNKASSQVIIHNNSHLKLPVRLPPPKDSEFEGIVVHHRNGNTLFVQLLQEAELLNELAILLNEGHGEHIPQSLIHCGIYCKAFYEGEYSRASIISDFPSQSKIPRVNVYFIDFGLIESLPIVNLHVIADDLVTNYPPLAVKCRFDFPEQMPTNTEEFMDLRLRFKECLPSDGANVFSVDTWKVERVRPDTFNTLKLYKGFPTIGSLPHRNRENVGKQISVTKVHQEDKIFYFINSQDEKGLDMIKNLLDVHFTRRPVTNWQYASLCPKWIVLADYGDYDYPFRAHIDKIRTSEKLIDVSFIDYGNRATVHRDHIYLIPPPLLHLPPLCFPCVVPSSLSLTEVDSDVEKFVIKLDHFDDEIRAWLLDSMDVVDAEPRHNQLLPKGDVAVSDDVLTLPNRNDGIPISHSPLLAARNDKVGDVISGYIAYVDHDIGYVSLNTYADTVHLNQIQDYLNKEETKRTMQKLTANSPIGNFCCAAYGDEVFRANIFDKIPDKGWLVEFVDYGNTDLVKDIFELPHSYSLVPPLCIKCRFPNMAITDFEVNNEVSFKLIESEENGTWFVERLPLSMLLKEPEVEIDHSSFQTKVTHVLCSDLTLNETRLPSRPDFGGSVVLGNIVYIDKEASVFYIHLDSEEEQLSQLQSHLNPTVTEEENVKLPFHDIKVGLLSKAWCEGEFYRAKILECESEVCIKVEFIDYGNISTVEEVFILDPSALSIHPLCVKCHLVDTSVESFSVDDHVNFLCLEKNSEDVWDSRVVQGSLSLGFAGIKEVQLLDLRGEDETIKNDQSNHSHLFKPTRIENSILDPNQPFVEVPTKACCISVRENSIVSQNGSSTSSQLLSEDKEIKHLSLPLRQENSGITMSGSIVYIDLETSLVYITLESDYEKLTQMADGLNAKVEGKENTKLSFDHMKTGLLCKALYEGEFYRAKILRWETECSITIEFIDYGNIVMVEEVFALEPSALSVDSLCVKCRPLNAALTSYYVDEEVTFLFLEKDKEGVWNGIISPASLAIADSENQCSNNTLQKDQLQDQKNNHIQVGTHNQIATEMTAQIYETPQPTGKESTLNGFSASDRENTNYTENESSAPHSLVNTTSEVDCSSFVRTEILPTRPDITDLIVSGIIVYIDEEASVFYIHLDSEEEQLSQLQSHLNPTVTEEENVKLPFHDIKVGLLSKALYEGEFYRAKILECESEVSIKVEFIDYGNISTVEEVFILDPFALSIHPLCVKCHLVDTSVESFSFDDHVNFRCIEKSSKDVWSCHSMQASSPECGRDNELLNTELAMEADLEQVIVSPILNALEETKEGVDDMLCSDTFRQNSEVITPFESSSEEKKELNMQQYSVKEMKEVGNSSAEDGFLFYWQNLAPLCSRMPENETEMFVEPVGTSHLNDISLIVLRRILSSEESLFMENCQQKLQRDYEIMEGFFRKRFGAPNPTVYLSPQAMPVQVHRLYVVRIAEKFYRCVVLTADDPLSLFILDAPLGVIYDSQPECTLFPLIEPHQEVPPLCFLGLMENCSFHQLPSNFSISLPLQSCGVMQYLISTENISAFCRGAPSDSGTSAAM